MKIVLKLSIWIANILAIFAGTLDLTMPGVKPDADELYLCKAFKLEGSSPMYITEYKPKASQMVAHHMLLHGCEEPGVQEEGKVWNCGEMRAKSHGFGQGPVCNGAYHIIYAWAKDAPSLKLPKGVGFKVGAGTQTTYLVLQVHYMMAMDVNDKSGLTATYTTTPTPKLAGVLLHATGGVIGPRSEANFDAACSLDEDLEVHPFGFRTHTHKLGNLVSGWRVRQDGESGMTRWDLIGRKNPQKPQMFYPVNNTNMVIRQGDVIASRCNMYNWQDEPVYIGSTGNDEMCNFYTMYWVEGDNLVKDWTCYSAGPPNYSWEESAGLEVPTAVEYKSMRL